MIISSIYGCACIACCEYFNTRWGIWGLHLTFSYFSRLQIQLSHIPHISNVTSQFLRECFREIKLGHDALTWQYLIYAYLFWLGAYLYQRLWLVTSCSISLHDGWFLWQGLGCHSILYLLGETPDIVWKCMVRFCYRSCSIWPYIQAIYS